MYTIYIILELCTVSMQIAWKLLRVPVFQLGICYQ